MCALSQALVKLSKASDMTAGGLFVAAEATEKPREGTVVAAGPGSHHPETGVMMPCPVKEGDYVLLAEFTGEKVDYNGEQHIFCDADSLLGSFDGSELKVGAFRPLGDLVMVAMADMETETTSGIALAGLEEALLDALQVDDELIERRPLLRRLRPAARRRSRRASRSAAQPCTPPCASRARRYAPDHATDPIAHPRRLYTTLDPSLRRGSLTLHFASHQPITGNSRSRGKAVA